MTCSECSEEEGYNHCTCYLHGKFGLDPANGSMAAIDWYNSCDLVSPPNNKTKYLLCSQGHVAIRDGDFYYYHPGEPGEDPRKKEHSSSFVPGWVGC